ncbi:MAG: hypothetical protein M1832_002859 [Thelocarpon impressellum]|nr:MAG: hypothetical protein M1832_002859 [Thelocarpon impressellum]
MNTIKSFWVGWGSLIVAGAGAYYFAKKSITADRAERHEQDMRRKRLQDSLEQRAPPKSLYSNERSRASDYAGSPSQEASSDPAPTRHAPENEGQRVKEKSKYEASEPFRAKRGDRFS